MFSGPCCGYHACVRPGVFDLSNAGSWPDSDVHRAVLQVPRVRSARRSCSFEPAPPTAPAARSADAPTATTTTLAQQDVLPGCDWDTKPALPHQEDVPFHKRNPPISPLPGYVLLLRKVVALVRPVLPPPAPRF